MSLKIAKTKNLSRWLTRNCFQFTLIKKVYINGQSETMNCEEDPNEFLSTIHSLSKSSTNLINTYSEFFP